jgi:choline dehydrogenase
VDGYDVVVLGGGPAGCAIAARLSEDPARTVCLVEAGPDHGPWAGGRWPAELLDPSLIPETHDWRDEHGSLPWARAVGGCSVHNPCGVARGPAADYDAWASEGGDGWRWATLEPCLTRARAALRARARAPAELGIWHAALLEAAVEAGLQPLDGFDAERSGAAVMPTNVVDATRHNAAFAYLDPARDRANLTIAATTLVDRVVLEGDRATGAVVHGPDGERTLRAGRVVLTAGAYGSPAILLRSGIGPEDELAKHGIAVTHARAGVGATLGDHCRAGLGFAPRPRAADAMRAERGDRAIGAQAALKWRSPFAGDAPWDVHLLAIVPSDRSQGRITAGLVDPRSRGRVRLRSARPGDLPDVENGFLSDPDGHDLDVLEAALEFARELGATRAVRRLAAGEIDPGPGVAVRAHARATVATYYHPTGTCRLGRPDDPAAVVGADAAVHGIERLHVGDASIVPHPVRAGTHLTTLAVAERVAELLRDAA